MGKFWKVCLPTRRETGLGFDPTFFGGFVSLRLYLSPVSQSCWWPLRRQIPCFTGDMMVVGHRLQPGRSMSLQHVVALDMRLMVASKNYEELSSGRRSASSCRWLRSPATRSTGRTMILQRLGCTFIFFQRFFVRFDVNIKQFM